MTANSQWPWIHCHGVVDSLLKEDQGDIFWMMHCSQTHCYKPCVPMPNEILWARNTDSPARYFLAFKNVLFTSTFCLPKQEANSPHKP